MWSTESAKPLALLIAGVVLLVVSGIAPEDRATWVLEVFPVLLAIPLLLFTYKRFPLTPLLYSLIFIHAAVLAVGGHYTYAKVPLGFWVEDWLDLARNPYDRLAHFAQGFVPALIVREILVRRSPLKSGNWLSLVVICVCLAISAFYELIEWGAAISLGQAADAFLGTQGDVWDTQWDMFMALIGAISSLLLLGKWHDRRLARLV